MQSDAISKRWIDFTVNLKSLLSGRDMSILDNVSPIIDEAKKILFLNCSQSFHDLVEKVMSKDECDIFKKCKDAYYGSDFTIQYKITNEPLVRSSLSVHKNIFMDRNLTRNHTAFQIFGEDSTLEFSILIYVFKNNISTDLFGNTRIDPYDFASFSGYTRTHLFRIVDNPAQIKRWLRTNKRNKKEYTEKDYTEASQRCIEQEGYLFATTLENVLFRMMTEPLVFGREVKSSIYENEYMAIRKEGDKVISIDTVQLIKKLDIVSNNERGKTSKKYYDIKFDETLHKNILEWFSILEHIPIRKAIVSNKRDTMPFYGWLQDLREICRKSNEISIKPEFDLVIKQAGINSSLEPKHQKQKLLALFKSVMSYDETIVLKLAKKGRYEYQPIFLFINNMNIAKEINTHKSELCYQDFIIDLKGLYRTAIQKNFDSYNSQDLELFNEWLKSENSISNKKNLFVKCLDNYFIRRNKSFDAENFYTTINAGELSCKKLF